MEARLAGITKYVELPAGSNRLTLPAVRSRPAGPLAANTPMNSRIFAILTFAAALTLTPEARAAPPFDGTIFIDPDIITAQDPTTFVSAVGAGQGNRQMYDRRVNNFITVNALLITATYSDGLSIEVQVNPEFSTAALAMVEAQKYCPVVGRLPKVLRQNVQTMWIHKGLQPFGGGNNNLLIHTEQGDDYAASGILEETFVHEASHTSLDNTHAAAPGWLAAQVADPEFISTYARDNPTREDVAETFLTWLAVRYRPDRITPALANTIKQAIPNRLAYFDSKSFVMAPLLPPVLPEITGVSTNRSTGKMTLAWSSQAGKSYRLSASSNRTAWQDLTPVIASGGSTTSFAVDPPAGTMRWFLRVREQ